MTQTHRNPLLQELPMEQVVACRVLEQYPLHRYSPPGELDMLLLGSGPMTEQLLTNASCVGQIPNRPLTIHTIHANAAAMEDSRTRLKKSAPMITSFTNLGEHPEAVYVTYDFDVMGELAGDEASAARAVLNRWPHARWIAVDLGDAERSRALAAALSLCTEADAVLLYAGMEPCPPQPGHPRPVPMLLRDEAAVAMENQLARLAAGIDWFYTKQFDPSASRARQQENFSRDAYAQRASLHSALFSYKLDGMGICVDQPLHCIAADVAGRVFADPAAMDLAICIEHRRWLMSSTMAGYTLPTMDQLATEIYVPGNTRFNHRTRKLHNCMVISRPGPNRTSRSREDWDAYPDYDAVDRTSLDPLDRMSIKCHMLAGKLLREACAHREEHLNALEARVMARAADEQAAADAREALTAFREWYLETTNTGRDNRSTTQQLQAIQRLLDRDCPEDANALQRVTFDVKLAIEYYSCHDFKETDTDVVEQLPLLYCRPDKLVLVKLISPHMVDNVSAALLLEPEEVIYVGRVAEEPLRAFFHGRGDNETLRFLSEPGELKDALARLMQELSGPGVQVVADVTGADALGVAAAMNVAFTTGMGVIHTGETGVITNLWGFPLGQVVRRRVSLRADEVILLGGGHTSTSFTGKDSISAFELRRVSQILWDYYCEEGGRERWKAFMSCAKRQQLAWGVCLFVSWNTHQKLSLLNRPVEVAFTLPAEKAAAADVPGLLSTLKDTYGLLRDFTASSGGSDVTFTLTASSLLAGELQGLADYLIATAPLALEVSTSGKGLWVRNTRHNHLRGRYAKATEAHTREVLSFLVRQRLLIPAGQDAIMPGDDFCYLFNSDALPLCLVKEGSLLEVRAAQEALDLRCISDVCLGHTIHWSEDNASYNEADVVAVSGLRTIIISCKDTAPKTPDVVEAAYIASRFSGSSRALLATTNVFAREQEETLIRDRARLSGVTYVSHQDMADGRLKTMLLEALGQPEA